MTYGEFLAYIDKYVLLDRCACNITVWGEPCNITPSAHEGCYGRVICSEKSEIEVWLTPDENDYISVNLGCDKLINHVKATRIHVEQDGDTFKLYSHDLLDKFNPIIIKITKK